MLMDSLPDRLNLLVGERSSGVVYSNVLDSQIDAENVVWFKRCFFRHVASSVQEELAIPVNQINLTANPINASSEVRTDVKAEQLSSFQRRDTNLRVLKVQALERQNAGVVSDAAVFLKLGLYLLVQFVRFAGFGNGTNAQLSREVIFLTDRVINQSLYRILACSLLGKAGFGNLVTGGVERFHCSEQSFRTAFVCQ